MAFTSLSLHIDLEWLREAYRRTRKDGATGIDGVTAEEYAKELDKNLQSLLDRAKSGTYRAPPVRRIQIPKADGKQMRPIGIPRWLPRCPFAIKDTRDFPAISPHSNTRHDFWQ
jgi:retron-type reverse transcriptase